MRQGKIRSSELKNLNDHSIHDRCYDLLDTISAAIYTCDLDGRLTYFNKAAAELWGREPELKKDLWCGSFKIFTLHGEPLPLDNCPMAEVLKRQIPSVTKEVVVERPDGRRVNVKVHPKLTYDRDGKPYGAVNLLVDISEKREKEEALRESETRYRKLSAELEKIVEERTKHLKISEMRYHKMVEEVEDYAIMFLDADGYILNWNKGIKKIKGYKESEILGKHFSIFYLEKDRELGLPAQLLETARQNNRAYYEGWRMRKDGKTFWGSIVLTLLRDEEGKIMGFSKVTRDLTERKLADDRKERYAREIEFRNTQLEEYAHVASHDLQEPLRKVQIFTDLLSKNLDDREKVNLYLERIQSSAKRMSSLIRDILKYSRVSYFEGMFQRVDLNQVFKNVTEDFNLLIEEKNVHFKSGRLPVVEGVPIQLHQLFSNLIGNSIKFSSKDPAITLRSRKVSQKEINENSKLQKGIRYHCITIEDNGIGFDEKEAESIFILFKRLHKNEFGNGIGLPLCKKIVENHQGRISASSQPGVGTCFTIYLPASPPPHK